MTKRDGWGIFVLVLALAVAGLVWSGEKDVKAEKKSQVKRDITIVTSTGSWTKRDVSTPLWRTTVLSS